MGWTQWYTHVSSSLKINDYVEIWGAAGTAPSWHGSKGIVKGIDDNIILVEVREGNKWGQTEPFHISSQHWFYRIKDRVKEWDD